VSSDCPHPPAGLCALARFLSFSSPSGFGPLRLSPLCRKLEFPSRALIGFAFFRSGLHDFLFFLFFESLNVYYGGFFRPSFVHHDGANAFALFSERNYASLFVLHAVLVPPKGPEDSYFLFLLSPMPAPFVFVFLWVVCFWCGVFFFVCVSFVEKKDPPTMRMLPIENQGVFDPLCLFF